MRQGKKQQLARSRAVVAENTQLRDAMRRTAVEVNSGRVLDMAVKNVLASAQFPGLAPALNAEIDRLIEPLKENSNNGDQDTETAEETDSDSDAAAGGEGAEAGPVAGAAAEARCDCGAHDCPDFWATTDAHCDDPSCCPTTSAAVNAKLAD